LAFVSDAELEDHWVNSFLSWATGDEQSRRDEDDAKAELSIRGRAPPADRIPHAIAAVERLPEAERVRLFQRIAFGEPIRGFKRLFDELQGELSKPYNPPIPVSPHLMLIPPRFRQRKRLQATDSSAGEMPGEGRSRHLSSPVPGAIWSNLHEAAAPRAVAGHLMPAHGDQSQLHQTMSNPQIESRR
jgi:hypothetical protein